MPPTIALGGGWVKDGTDTYEQTKPLAAGGVTGTVGVLQAANTQDSGNGYVTTGAVGATWSGSQVNHSDDSDSGELIVSHKYRRTNDGTGVALTFSLQSSITVSGSASRYQPGTWWWNSKNNVDETFMAEMVDVLGVVQPLTVTYLTNVQATAHGGDSGNQPPHPSPHSSNNNNSTSPPSSTSQFDTNFPLRTNGTTQGSFSLPDNLGWRAKVFAWYTCSATGCVDNATVANDQLKLTFTFTSHL